MWHKGHSLCSCQTWQRTGVQCSTPPALRRLGLCHSTPLPILSNWTPSCFHYHHHLNCRRVASTGSPASRTRDSRCAFVTLRSNLIMNKTHGSISRRPEARESTCPCHARIEAIGSTWKHVSMPRVYQEARQYVRAQLLAMRITWRTAARIHARRVPALHEWLHYQCIFLFLHRMFWRFQQWLGFLLNSCRG